MIKVLVPSMPTADELLPYLRQIDAEKIYVNHGPQVSALEARFEAILGVPCALVSNGTIALELAIQTIHSFAPSVFILPALTFAATGLAVKRMGVEPLLADVDNANLQMSQRTAQDALRRGLDFGLSPKNKFGLLPVAVFGTPVVAEQWENSNMPVVIDAAGAIDTQTVSEDPNIATCFSLHATKLVGAGEGGIVACSDQRRIDKIRKLANFGFNGTNAKMSEYHAAVGLASLDRADAQPSLTWIAAAYHAKLGLRMLRSGTLCVVELPRHVRAGTVRRHLYTKGIESKLWYRPFLNERQDFMQQKLHVTDYVRDHLIGLPFHQFLTQEDVINVIEAVKEVLDK